MTTMHVIKLSKYICVSSSCLAQVAGTGPYEWEPRVEGSGDLGECRREFGLPAQGAVKWLCEGQVRGDIHRKRTIMTHCHDVSCSLGLLWIHK